jgi:PEP-CTERM motif
MKTLSNLNRFASLSVLAAALMCCSVGRAGITGVTNWGGSSGIDCWGVVFDNSPHLTVAASQYNAGPVQMWGTILADTPSDPTLTINDQINNESGIDWSGFVLDVYMSTNFSLTLPASPVANPLGWTGSITIAPTYVSPGQYMGQITFSGGTFVSADTNSVNNLLDFTYKITFNGSTSYSLGETATAIPVPEPATFGCVLLGLGALIGSWRMKQKWNI